MSEDGNKFAGMLGDMLERSRQRRLAELGLEPTPPIEGSELLATHGIETVRKALGLYQAALACASNGGEVVLRSKDGKERRWVPKP